MPKDVDIVIHGATGFTGRRVAEVMAQRYPMVSGHGRMWRCDALH